MNRFNSELFLKGRVHDKWMEDYDFSAAKVLRAAIKSCLRPVSFWLQVLAT